MKYLYLVIALLLLMCLFPMPYGYYTLVRFISMIGFAYIALGYYRKKEGTLMVTFLAMSILFQPFIKIALGRIMWNIVDLIVAIFLLLLYYKHQTKK